MKNIVLLAGLFVFAAAQQSSFTIGAGFIKFPVDRHNFTASALRSGKRQDSVDLTKQELGTSYTIQLQLGTPPQNAIVQLDTGSTDLWVNPNCANIDGATQVAFCNSFPRYSPAASSSFVDTGAGTTLQYGKGDATIEYVKDFVRAGCEKLPSHNPAISASWLTRKQQSCYVEGSNIWCSQQQPSDTFRDPRNWPPYRGQPVVYFLHRQPQGARFDEQPRL